ncbi:MAG: sulfite exporter TauE/SafE family protein, partial [Candidatus Rokubacteria bacterium]|nr:sulfite exporter TauE/SafE family protein [Candidatus Rokubacteria bacterium]
LWEHRGHLRRDLLREVPPFAPWSLALLVAGVVLGTFVLGRISPAGGRLALAVVVLTFVVFQAVRPKRRVLPGVLRGAWTGAGVAFVGGFLDGWLSTGGVAIAVYLTWKQFAPRLFVAAMLVYFLAADLLRVISYTAFGYWTPETVALYLRAVPIALAGYVGGVALRRFLVPSEAFRGVVLLLLTAYGLALVGRILVPP